MDRRGQHTLSIESLTSSGRPETWILLSPPRLAGAAVLTTGLAAFVFFTPFEGPFAEVTLAWTAAAERRGRLRRTSLRSLAMESRVRSRFPLEAIVSVLMSSFSGEKSG